jgi:YidC/Oxa1 family membrane protein insertase
VLHLLDPAVHIAYLAVTTIAALLPFGGGAATALAIVAFTVAMRLCLSPLAFHAARGDRSRARLAPDLARLRARHAKDPARLAEEIRRLHEREGVRPLAGCLPQLLQMPVLSVVYRLFVADTVAGQPNLLLATTLFGAPLGSSWPAAVAASGLLSGPGLLAALLVGSLVVLAVLSSRQARARGVAVAGPAAAIAALLPFTTLVVAAVVPMATAVYLLTSGTWSLGERAVLARLTA